MILARTRDELSRGHACNQHTDTQTQAATTIPQGQHWPKVKISWWNPCWLTKIVQPHFWLAGSRCTLGQSEAMLENLTSLWTCFFLVGFSCRRHKILFSKFICIFAGRSRFLARMVVSVSFCEATPQCILNPWRWAVLPTVRDWPRVMPSWNSTASMSGELDWMHP